MRIPFLKMVGAGNDFVVVDDALVGGWGEPERSRLAGTLCARRLSVGADGLVTVGARPPDRVRMVYYNADGSRAGMCGNAGRCASRYAVLRGWVPEHLVLEADDGDHPAEVRGDRVRLGMRDPEVRMLGLVLQRGGRAFEGMLIDTGVPHAVLWVDEVDALDVRALGREFRHAQVFGREGANVNFVEVVGREALKTRTYERGVEDETLACGTGAAAAAVAAHLQWGIPSPVEVRPRGGTLTVSFESGPGAVRAVTLEGDARIAYEGTVDVAV
jgi:diaminopimelate epimerase